MKPLSEIIKDDFKEATDVLSPQLLPSVQPIYGADQEGLPFQIGSAIFIKIENLHFLVTAAHVLEWNKETSLYVGTGSKLSLVDGQFHILSNGGTNQIDLAFMLIKNEIQVKFKNIRFIGINELDVNDDGNKSHAYLVLGFPNSKNKSINKHKKIVKPNPLIFTGVSGFKKNTYDKLNIYEETHLLVKYNKRKIQDESDKIMFAPDPIGISGGGVWRIRQYGKLDTYQSKNYEPKLVAVLIEWHREHAALMSIRVSALVQALRSLYPEIASSLPVIKRVAISF